MFIICEKQCLALFQRSVDSLKVLQGFWLLDDVARQEHLQTLQRTLDSWYYGFGSPAVAGILESVEDDTGGTTMDTSMHWLIKEQIPDLIRISFTGPSNDIRAFAKDLLMDLKTKKGFRIPHVHLQSPSSLLDLREIPHLECMKEEPLEGEHLFTTYALFREHWFQWGRLENYICLMGFHPEYLECFMKVQNHLFHGDLPIPYPDRQYLALLAAAEQRCVYLVFLFARQFLFSGGDPVWLQGLNHGPVKWRQLAKLNSDLCSTPWNVTADQIYDLTHGGSTNSSRETLSLSELMHALAIMTHVHALACFVFGCSVAPELDQVDCMQFTSVDPANQTNGMHHASKSSSDDRHASLNETDNLGGHQCPCAKCAASNQAVPSSKGQSPTADASDTSANLLLQRIQEGCRDWEELDEDAVFEQFETIIQSNKKLDLSQLPESVAASIELRNSLNRHTAIARFIPDPSSVYENFDAAPFHVNEFYWQEEGHALTDRLCTDLGTLLEEKFRNTYELTYNTLSSITGVDTTLYRRTVWNFVQSLFGLCHDDSRYDHVGQLLSTQEQVFLKLCATRPDAVNPYEKRFEAIFSALSPPEVIHVILMVIEARQQACLLYALRAISECQARVAR